MARHNHHENWVSERIERWIDPDSGVRMKRVFKVCSCGYEMNFFEGQDR